MGTVLVGAIVLACVALAIRSLRKDKKNGKSSCGGDCAHCRGCHQMKNSRLVSFEISGGCFFDGGILICLKVMLKNGFDSGIIKNDLYEQNKDWR